MKRLMALLGVLVLAGFSQAAAGEYPERAIRIVVPYPAGGTADILARIVADRLTTTWSQQVIVEPRPGAGGNIGSDIVAKSTRDGYTLLLGTSGSNAVNPSLYTKMPYDARRDLTFVAPVASTANILVVGPKSPANSVKDLLQLARSQPRKLTFGSSGNGSVLHLSGELLKTLTGVDMVHVPYKGTPPALVDVMSGRVDMMIANAPSVVSQIKGGALRGLAVTTAQRLDVLPELPTMIEAGVAGFDVASWFGVFAPRGTPKDVLDKLNAEVRKMLGNPDTKAKLGAQGAQPMPMTADEADRFFLDEISKWAKVVKASGAKVD